MTFLDDEIVNKLKTEFDGLAAPVRIVYFTQELECEYCRETHELLKEIAAVSDRLTLEVYNFAMDTAQVEQYRVDKIPAVAIIGERDYGIRFYGVPSGYEFMTLIEGIKDVSRGRTDLPENVRETLRQIDRPVHVQVFATPTCPYCPRAVRFAHKAAIESEFVTADMVEASEFPHLVYKYAVQGVPKTVINEEDGFAGAVPEHLAAQRLLEASRRAAEAISAG